MDITVLTVMIMEMIFLQRGEFRQATEDRHTHLYQNPWYVVTLDFLWHIKENICCSEEPRLTTHVHLWTTIPGGTRSIHDGGVRRIFLG